MFRTEICNILEIEYPIILGGMLWIGKSDLVAAVSEAGGLGLLGAGGMTIEEIIDECGKIKKKAGYPSELLLLPGQGLQQILCRPLSLRQQQ